MNPPPFNPYAAPTAPLLHAEVPLPPPRLELAERGARFVANLIDSLAVFALGFALGLAVVVFDGMRAEPTPLPGLAGGELVLLAGYAGLGIGCMVQIGFQLRFAQSIGKRIMKIRVVHPDGRTPNIFTIVLLRNLCLHAIGFVCGLVGLVDALLIYAEDRRCLHDYFAKTIVVRA